MKTLTFITMMMVNCVCDVTIISPTSVCYYRPNNKIGLNITISKLLEF